MPFLGIATFMRRSRPVVVSTETCITFSPCTIKTI
jgi:hypothetical protein